LAFVLAMSIREKSWFLRYFLNMKGRVLAKGGVLNMTYRTRLKYTDEMKTYISGRYQQGDAVKAIARSLGRPSSSIHAQRNSAI
jgi:hypothetical protein